MIRVPELSGNGNGYRNGWRTLPWSAIITVMLATSGMVSAVIIWGTKQESHISGIDVHLGAIDRRLDIISQQIDDVARRVALQDERLTSAVSRNNSQDDRMERIERGGSRQIPVIEERLTQLQRRVDAIAQALQQNNFRLQSIDPPR